MSKHFSFPCLIILILGLSQFVFANAGDLDETFDNDGIVNSTVLNTSTSGAIDILIQTDGKLLVLMNTTSTSGSDFILARYKTDGSFDENFGENGLVRSPFNNTFDLASGIALQTDGKILVAARFDISPTQYAVVRYNSDGTLDASFDGDGIVIKRILESSVPTSIAVQADGKIVVGGNSLNNSNVDFLTFTRFNQDGSTDNSFGNSGNVFANFGIIDFFEDLIIQPDGKILGVGTGNVGSSTPTLAMIRLDSNGSFDTSFDGDGIVTAQPQFFEETSSVDLQNDGKIVVAGRLGGSIAVFRFNANGSLDSTLDTDGIAIADLGSFSNSEDIKVQKDGKIVVGGDFISIQTRASKDFTVVRFNSDGTLDPDFGKNGIVKTLLSPNNDDFIRSIAIQEDKKIVVAGSSGELTEERATIIRYLGKNLAPNRTKFDFDGDGKSDLSVFRPDANNPSNWYVLNSSNSSFTAVQFGLGNDRVIPADYDGDGKTDLAIYRNGIWYVLNSFDGTIRIESFGLADDKPFPNDFDGDQMADLAVYRDGFWHIFGSTQGYYVVKFGVATDKPVPDDFDGDGKTDQAIYRDGFWHILQSNLGYTVIQFGINTDKPLSADYDGDSKADLSVYRNGVWHVLESTQGYNVVQFGIDTDIPVPSDFDGDAKVDRAVYRNGTWHILGSDSGYVVSQFGLAEDIPTQTSFNRK